MNEDDREALDGEAVEQPDREAPDVYGEEAGRDIAGGATHIHLTSLE
jgi:hypothetical protein